MTTTRNGTHYFLNQNAAIRYYATQGTDRKEVARKLRDKEICLGMPPKREGSRIVLNGKEGRYYYEETTPTGRPEPQPQIQNITPSPEDMDRVKRMIEQNRTPIDVNPDYQPTALDRLHAELLANNAAFMAAVRYCNTNAERGVHENDMVFVRRVLDTPESVQRFLTPDPAQEVQVDSLHIQSSSMTLDQIKKAVDDGLTVHWKTDNFTVIKDAGGAYMLRDDSTGNSIITLDEQTEGGGFYITDKKVTPQFGMTLDQIKQAVDEGRTVHWSNERYTVIKDNLGQYLITCDGGSTIGLTWKDGITLNGREDQFYMPTPEPVKLHSGGWVSSAAEKPVTVVAELRDAHEGSGSDLSFHDWLQEMANNPNGTLQLAAQQYLSEQVAAEKPVGTYEMIVDHHVETAAQMFNVKPEDVTLEQRKAGKNRNFLTDYTTSKPLEGLKNETSKVQIKTNNVPKELLFFSALTQAERAELDYVTEDTNSFFRHKGVVYDAGEFLQIQQDHQAGWGFYDYRKQFAGWDGIFTETYSSGLLIRYPRDEQGEIDPERVVIGTFYVGDPVADPRATNNVPNLDAKMEPRELRMFYEQHQNGRNYKGLFPSGGEGTKNATADLANYAINKVTALGLRLDGKIAKAQEYEDICDSIYKDLPAWAKSW